MLTKKQILTGAWCNTCAKTQATIERFVRENKGELLDRRLSKTIRIRCEKGHVWETSQKKACLKWCKECSKSSKRLLKEMINHENKRLRMKSGHSRYAHENQMFEEARKNI